MSSKVNTPEFTGSGPCGKPRCKLCPMMSKVSTVTSTASSFSYQIRGNFNCDSANIIYLLECTLCHAQYIGQTETAFRMRINNHRAHVKSLPHLPLSKHVNNLGHPFHTFSAVVLQSSFKTHYDREARESYLIHKFNSVSGGINESIGRLSCMACNEPEKPNSAGN